MRREIVKFSDDLIESASVPTLGLLQEFEFNQHVRGAAFAREKSSVLQIGGPNLKWYYHPRNASSPLTIPTAAPPGDLCCSNIGAENARLPCSLNCAKLWRIQGRYDCVSEYDPVLRSHCRLEQLD